MKIYIVQTETEIEGVREFKNEFTSLSFEDAQKKMKELTKEEWFKNLIDDETNLEIGNEYVKSDILYSSDWCDITIETVEIANDKKTVSLTEAKNLLGMDIEISWNELMDERWKNLDEDIELYLENAKDFTEEEIKDFLKNNYQKVRSLFLRKVNNDDAVCESINNVLSEAISNFLD